MEPRRLRIDVDQPVLLARDDDAESSNPDTDCAAQGWTALVVDTNSNGRRDEDYNEPGSRLIPARTPAFHLDSTASP